MKYVYIKIHDTCWKILKPSELSQHVERGEDFRLEGAEVKDHKFALHICAALNKYDQLEAKKGRKVTE